MEKNYCDAELVGENTVPPELRGYFKGIVDDYMQGIMTSDEVIDSLVAECSMSEDDAEEILYRIESSGEF
jgi:hypothetical protein